MEIKFNKPYFTGNENLYINEAISRGKISGNGMFTKKCHAFFEEKYGFNKTLLTTSCTDALEMASILVDIQPGDEVIIPSFTFVSTANSFVLRGAKIIFADSKKDHPNIDETKIELLISSKTKAIVVVHYAGHSCEMDTIMAIAKKHNLFVIEDAAQAIDGYYKGKPLGGIGHFGTFSFHETKNIITGEGGMLVINDKRFIERAEIIWEKGTNRTAFFRGEVDKYGWVDIGSSFLPSEVTAAILYAQLEHLNQIQKKRIKIWNTYFHGLLQLEMKGYISLPKVFDYSTNNAHMFYLVCSSEQERDNLIGDLKKSNIHAVFHYQSLHKSSYFKEYYKGEELKQSDNFTKKLVRLPLYYELEIANIELIINKINLFFNLKNSTKPS